MKTILDITERTPKLICFIVASGFALLLASLQIDGFVDRDNYLSYASGSPLFIGRYIASGPLAVITNEPIWLLINMALSFFFPPDWVLRSIIFYSTFVTFYVVIRNIELKYLIFVILLLLLPSVLKNNIIHLRQGLAVSFFLLGWFSNKAKMRYFFLMLAAFIHSSFIIVFFGVIAVNFMFYLNLSYSIRNILYTVIALFIGVSALYIANSLGARQGEGYQESASISGLNFIFWGGVTSLFLLQGRDYLHEHAHTIFFLFLYLGTYFLLPVTARVFESVLLIVLLSSLRLKKYLLTFSIVYLVYFILLWSAKLGKPGFGWGIENYV